MAVIAGLVNGIRNHSFMIYGKLAIIIEWVQENADGITAEGQYGDNPIPREQDLERITSQRCFFSKVPFIPTSHLVEKRPFLKSTATFEGILNARQLPFHAINSHAVGEIIHFND
jgi:hypothetical protein